MLTGYVPILLFLVILTILALIILVLSALFGPRHPTEEKMKPYECGIEPFGTARRRYSIKFFIIAMLFIIFDIEAIFLFPWAVIFKELKIFGFIEMAVFMLILFIGLIYVWKKGALEWE